MKDIVMAEVFFSIFCFIAFVGTLSSGNTKASLWFFDIGAAAIISAIIIYSVAGNKYHGKHFK